MKHTSIQFLEKAKLKKTPARLEIMDILLNTKTPINAYDIQKQLNQKPNIATIYRNLEQLKSSHLIHEITSKRGYIACNINPETSHTHHGFLICNDCGDVEEFAESSSSCQLSMQEAQKKSFQPQEHINEVLGLCHNCN